MHTLDILSLIANLVGILTFSIALSVSFAAFYVLTANALQEIESLQSEWNNAGKEIYLLLKYWERERSRENTGLDKYLRDMQDSMDTLAESALSIYRELRDFDPKFREVTCLDLDLRRRILWACKRQGIMEKMAEFSRRRQGLIHMQLGLLLTKSISQEIEAKSQMDFLKGVTLARETQASSFFKQSDRGDQSVSPVSSSNLEGADDKQLEEM
ncbi:hypothetical protein K432DRAFT_442455 [Lepidopterella palustris CBS 459.81]|uniref:Uncharacterized protein n=1 Tax=Lepidopterella palustris CBS 459.81 TaxID=1314670 RepID=A0A8E2ECL2_9PEZI|nr:hypothetical protein K432DRAFT_442455 [Lepidopterella palustris CBS 459.81]